jgi:hypothetical protein
MYSITSTWTELLQQFFPIFTAPGADIFMRLMTGWVLCTTRRTITGMLPFAEPLGLPINMRLHRKKERTLIELAEQMIGEVAKWFPERRFRVVGDGFYAALAGTSLEHTAILSRMRRDANLYDLPPKRRKKKRGRPRTRGKKPAKLETMANHVQNWKTVIFRQRGKTVKRQVYMRVVLWYTVSRKPVRLVISRDPNRKEKDDFFFTTDLGMTAQEVLECYNDRWAIKDTFKNTKQLLGGQQPQTFKGKGPERAAGLSLWRYSMVWLWYLGQKSENRYFMVQPWYGQKAMPSFADAIACLRRCLWRERIKYMFGNSAVHDIKFEFLLEALAPAA